MWSFCSHTTVFSLVVLSTTMRRHLTVRGSHAWTWLEICNYVLRVRFKEMFNIVYFQKTNKQIIEFVIKSSTTRIGTETLFNILRAGGRARSTTMFYVAESKPNFQGSSSSSDLSVWLPIQWPPCLPACLPAWLRSSRTCVVYIPEDGRC